ncbi:MAG: ParB/RepB/Spo0J family partition protein [Proteobacteria bacterium]|nr:ParB/RepB/Spo0J family partition protein [Pseudomonadota bacterium]
MMEDGRKRGLGRGLSALLQESSRPDPLPETRRGTHEVPIERIRPNPAQPRQRFDGPELEELAESIRANGVLQSILVRRADELGQMFEIVAGERRWRAAQKAGVHTIPVVVRDVSDAESSELALIENLQRQDLTALEEAEAYRHLIDDLGRTQEQIALSIGKSRSHVANTMRLLGLPKEVHALLQDGRLSPGHARALVGRDDAALLAEKIATEGLNVRQVEKLTRPGRAPREKAPPPPPDPNVRAFERELGHALGLKVEILDRGAQGGEVRIHYATLEQLDEVARRLGHAIAAE